MEKEKIKCPGCGHEIIMNLHEFVDVTTDPDYKEQIINGQFFTVKCPECGDETLAEYPIMYMDPSKKLTVYMAPGHDDSLLEQLNSLELPESDLDDEAVFRVVEGGAELLEKLLIFECGRDDRVIELYKALVYENIKDEWPHIRREDLLFFLDGEEEYFIVWDYTNAAGEQLTVNLDEELYDKLKDEYLPALAVPAGKYVEVDYRWLETKVQVE